MMLSHVALPLSTRLSRRLTSGSTPSGTIASNVRPTSGPKKSGGVTPTIVKGTFSIGSA